MKFLYNSTDTSDIISVALSPHELLWLIDAAEVTATDSALQDSAMRRKLEKIRKSYIDSLRHDIEFGVLANPKENGDV